MNTLPAQALLLSQTGNSIGLPSAELVFGVTAATLLIMFIAYLWSRNK